MNRRGRYKPKERDVRLLTEYVKKQPHLDKKLKQSNKKK